MAVSAIAAAAGGEHTIFHFYSNTHSYMASNIWHLYMVCVSPVEAVSVA